MLLPLLSIAVLTSRSAHAEDERSSPPGATNPGQAALVPPRLVEPIEPDYPPEALAARIEGSVVLRLTIDTKGHVERAEVKEPGGHGFDEAATAVAAKLRFEPAKRDGVPVAARILYRVSFRLPKAPAKPQKDPTPAATAQQSQTASSPVVTKTGGSDQQLNTIQTTTPAIKSVPQPIDVSVRGRQSATQRLRGSSEAVTVVDTYRARQQARDLADVLEGVEGVTIRRTGGLGSLTRFSLNGLEDDQVRFFLDDVPLEVAAGVSSLIRVPVNFNRIEIYRGVLPGRFGTDALGGGVNLVTDQSMRTRAGASYQRSSFGTYRASLYGRYRHEPSGFFAGGSAWLDSARNNYDVEVDIADRTGRIHPTKVKRLHDQYTGYGGSVELGMAGGPSARRLIVKLFGTVFQKELQHNDIMTIPYGEAETALTIFGATARYEEPLLPNLTLSVVAGASERESEFLDVSKWNYDWYGRRIRLRAGQGETQDTPFDLTLRQTNLFGRTLLEWRIVPEHSLRLTSAGSVAIRFGDERAGTPDQRLFNATWKNLSTVVSSIEYELNAFDMRQPKERAAAAPEVSRDLRLQNIVFGKHYFLAASANEPISADVPELDIEKNQFGVGDAVRFRFTEQLLAKASYEWATRFPTMDELYGDGATVIPNTTLEPSTSHNVNLELRWDLRRTKAGSFGAGVDGFLRDTDNLIKRFPDAEGRTSQHQNIYRVRALGVEGRLSYTSPGNWVVLDGNATWQDVRNTSKEGSAAQFEGDRVPNWPWLFANWSGRFQWRGVMAEGDELSPFYLGRYVHEFYRLWESIGNPQFKAKVPSQIVHSLGLSYTVRLPSRVVTTFEIDNLLDEKLFDFFGVQRPGRSFAVKVTGDL